MIFKTRNLILLFLFVASCQESLQGMSRAKRLLTSPTAKNIGAAGAAALAGGLTAVHYGIALQPAFRLPPNGFFLPSISDEDANRIPDVSPEVFQFVYNELKKREFSQERLKRLKVKKYHGFGAAHSTEHDYIFIENAEIMDIVIDSIQKRDLDSNLDLPTMERNNKPVSYEQFLLEQASQIHHEAQHIESKDPITSSALIRGATAVLCTEAIFLALKKSCRPSNYLIKNFAKIPLGYVKCYSNALICTKLSRDKEYRADNGIPANIPLLRAAITEFQESDPETNPKKVYWFENFYTHPTHEERIKRIEERIKALEEKNDPESYKNPFEVKEYSIV